MLKDQLKKGIPNGEEMLQAAEEKEKLLQEEIEEKETRIKQLEEEQASN
eukprot:CAMPEP_0170462444 /NCGR_PEP_ID=MMETSP0123-20130129/7945_1 /TAXON_ID=182087 /ORGANISM="Favella ehrenbergii, Strain Fehren 1" /LENGTH=48 /DNA_ID= /DNA_START= /DNA_END= /DNA_ORIENTATION=